jgi:hypothetical protein
MPATAAEATRVQPDSARDTPYRRPDPDARELSVRDWEEIARAALAATDEDDVPLFGRLPA